MTALSDVPTPVFIYLRVSTEEQAHEGYSIEAQERVQRAYCVVKNYRVAGVFVDAGFSAKNMNRPELKKMLAGIRSGEAKAILVWRLDRLSRSLKDTLHILEDILFPAGADLISTSENIDTSTPSGRLMLNILASFAQAERESGQERVKMVLSDLAKKGAHLGGIPPFGYKLVEGKYQVDEPKAEAVRTLFRMHRTRQGYADMLKYLHDNSFLTARGNQFGRNSLYDILSNEKYTGTYIYNRVSAATKDGKRNNHKSKDDKEIIRIPGAFPAIITGEEWQQSRIITLENRQTFRAYTAKQVYLLSGIIRCGVCNGSMHVVSGGKDRDGTAQRYYGCPKKCCKAARKEEVEFYIHKVIEGYLAYEDTIRQAIHLASELSDKETDADLSLLTAPITCKIDAMQQEVDGITAYIAQHGANAPASLMDKLELLDKQISQAQQSLSTIKQSYRQPDADRIIRTLKAAANMKDRPPEEQKALIQQAVRSVIVTDESYRVLIHDGIVGSKDCSLSGGGEENRTPVRRFRPMIFSERSLSF